MGDPLSLLRAEHRMIERVTRALCATVGRPRAIEPRELRALVRFFRAFVDEQHHPKEEELFAALVALGPDERQAVDRMIAEHERGRLATAALAELAAETGPVDVDRLAQVVAPFAAALREHMQHEETVLFPLAEAHLGDGAMLRLERAFDRLQTPRLEYHAELMSLGDELARASGC